MPPLARYRRSRRKSALLARLEYTAALPLLFLPQWCSLPTILRLARGVGSLACRLLTRPRAVAMRNLELAYGDALSLKERREIARKVFMNMACTAFELAAISRLGAGVFRSRVTTVGLEHLDHALARGKGVILCTAHLGNWELGGAWLGELGYPINVIVRPLDNILLEAWVYRCRTRCGMRVIPKSQGARQGVKALRRNEVVIVMVDQNAAKNGCFVDFYGIPAATSRGVCFFHRKTGAAVLPAISLRRGDGTHLMRVCSEITMSGEAARDLLAINAVFERTVRENVDNWFWVHPRWKKRPVGEAGLYPGLRV